MRATAASNIPQQLQQLAGIRAALLSGRLAADTEFRLWERGAWMGVWFGHVLSLWPQADRSV